MTLLAYGINYVTAPIELREKFTFPEERAKQALKDLIKMPAVNEAMILSTCNRVEIYSHTTEPETFHQWLQSHFNIKLDSSNWYSFLEKQAVSHIMRVASGLDSMVLGEPQILGQMKTAFNLAREVGSIGTQLQRLFQTVFNVTKQVRTDTSIGANPITLGYATTSLAKRIFSDLSKQSALLIGAGEIVELTGLHLYNQGVKRFVIAARSSSKAENLAKKLHGHVISLGDIPVYLKESDIVISATASELPILGKGAVETAIKARKHRPIFMVDLAVPRDIEPEVGAFEDIYLYNVDDLKSMVDDNRQCREAAAKQAESIIDLQASHFIKDLQALDANTIIKEYRTSVEQLCAAELEKALARLNQGIDSKQVLTQFAHQISNKLTHGPSTQMKKAAFDGRIELLAFARQLLDL